MTVSLFQGWKSGLIFKNQYYPHSNRLKKKTNVISKHWEKDKIVYSHHTYSSCTGISSQYNKARKDKQT